MDRDRARELPPGASNRARSTQRGKGNRRVVDSCTAAIGGINPEEEEEGNQDKVFASTVGSTLVASGAAGGKRRRAKPSVTSGARAPAKGREKDEVVTCGDLRSSREGLGSAVGSVPAGGGATGGKRRRTASGVVSGARTAAKGREEEEVATRGDRGSSRNERNGEDGVMLSLSAKAETRRPPGRPSVRRARCRQEVGRAGNKVRK